MSFVAMSALALVLIGGAGAVWAALLVANVRTTPSIPWALPALCVFLWVLWLYLGGRGWPARTSQARRRLLRANLVPPHAFAWAVAGGLLAVAALAGFWIAIFRLTRMEPNVLLPARFTSSPLFAVAIIVGASLLAPVVEESAIRGYLQVTLERDLSPTTAVALSSIVFAAAHVTQGTAWAKLLFYFLVGVTFGTIAALTDSILPVLPVHLAGDLLFFTAVWPFDDARLRIGQSGFDRSFWLHVAQTIVCGGLAVMALRRAKRGRVSQSATIPAPNAMSASAFRTKRP